MRWRRRRWRHRVAHRRRRGHRDGRRVRQRRRGDDLAAIKEAGTLRVGIKYDQPLFGVNTPSGVVGFDAEIAKLVAEAIFEDGDPTSHIEFTEAVSANREPFLQNDQVDIVAATYTINDERDQVVDFAGPYYVAGQDIMVPSGNPNGIESVDDLNTSDLTTCSVDGSTSIQNFEEGRPRARPSPSTPTPSAPRP